MCRIRSQVDQSAAPGPSLGPLYDPGGTTPVGTRCDPLVHAWTPPGRGSRRPESVESVRV